MKPRIKIWRNMLGIAYWQCTGVLPGFKHESYDLGNTPREAFEAWRKNGDIPF